MSILQELLALHEGTFGVRGNTIVFPDAEAFKKAKRELNRTEIFDQVDDIEELADQDSSYFPDAGTLTFHFQDVRDLNTALENIGDAPAKAFDKAKKNYDPDSHHRNK